MTDTHSAASSDLSGSGSNDEPSTSGSLASSNHQAETRMNDDRVQQFEDEVASMKLRGSSRDVEKWLQILAAVGLVGGLVLVLVGAFQVPSTSDDADQRAMLATSTYVGLAVVVVGAALFIRVSVGRLLRYWLIRIVHEQRSETDRLIEAIKDRD